MGDITEETIKIALIVVLLAIFWFVLTRKKK